MSDGEAIVVQRGDMRGMWFKTAEGYRQFTNDPRIKSLAQANVVLGSFQVTGLTVRVATAEEWAELQRLADEGGNTS